MITVGDKKILNSFARCIVLNVIHYSEEFYEQIRCSPAMRRL